MIGFINIFFYHISSSQSILALSLIYRLQNSVGHAPFSFSFSVVLRCTPTTARFGIRLSYGSSTRFPRKTLFVFCPKMRVYCPVTYQQMSFCCWERNSGNVFTEPLPSTILSRVGGLRVSYKTGFGLDDRIYWQLIHSQLETTGNTALSLIYTLYSSPLHTHYGSQSSLVVFWQRIYKRLTVTSNHTWSLFCTA
jgi:hypothetical protein